jgi:chemotaxis protein methyltransferase WspC
MGLDAASIGLRSVERAVRDQLAVLRMEPTAYLEHLHQSPSALQQLIESVVVPETWFFRDREAFVALARLAQEEWLLARTDRAMRLLSMPCSTGEEPYSMAIALLDAGIPPARFQIDAVDISERALGVAHHATYGRNAFRGADLAFRDRHFSVTPAGAVLDKSVRQQVRFQQSNLFAPEFLARPGAYDFVFCRNVMIYFDGDMRDRCLHLLKRLLTPDGVLFVGPSESALLPSYGFASIRIPLAFAFRKASSPVLSPVRPAPLPPLPPLPTPLRRSIPVASTKAPPTLPPESPLGIDAAIRLADQGRLAEAAAICEAHIRRHGSSAQSFYLMGLIHDAGGSLSEAEGQYRKALYLDQDHQDALAHLALLLERQGKRDTARLLRERARRVSAR